MLRRLQCSHCADDAVAENGRRLVIGLASTQAILQRRDQGPGATADFRLTRTERPTPVAPQPLIGGEPVGSADRRIDRGWNVDSALDLEPFEAVFHAPQRSRNARVRIGLAPSPAREYRTAVLVAGRTDGATCIADFRAAVRAIVRDDLELEAAHCLVVADHFDDTRARLIAEIETIAKLECGALCGFARLGIDCDNDARRFEISRCRRTALQRAAERDQDGAERRSSARVASARIGDLAQQRAERERNASGDVRSRASPEQRIEQRLSDGRNVGARKSGLDAPGRLIRMLWSDAACRG
jgi:hypothetical protein